MTASPSSLSPKLLQPRSSRARPDGSCPLASHGDHVTGKCRSQIRNRALSRITSFQPRPHLGLVEQGTKLVEQDLRESPLTTEPFDSTETLENDACLVHCADGSPRPVTHGRGSVPNGCQTAARSAARASTPSN